MKARYFFAVSFIALVAAVGFLIYHQRTANGMATKIEQADVAAQDAAMTESLAQLDRYVQSHMGVSAMVQLKGSYERATAAAKAAAGSQNNSQIYAQAQAACAKGDSITQSKCISAYVSSRSAPATNPQPVTMPEVADYTKSYYGSSWSMDGTGIALIVSMVTAAWGLFLLLYRPRSKDSDPHHHYRGPQPNPRL